MATNLLLNLPSQLLLQPVTKGPFEWPVIFFQELVDMPLKHHICLADCLSGRCWKYTSSWPLSYCKMNKAYMYVWICFRCPSPPKEDLFSPSECFVDVLLDISKRKTQDEYFFWKIAEFGAAKIALRQKLVIFRFESPKRFQMSITQSTSQWRKQGIKPSTMAMWGQNCLFLRCFSLFGKNCRRCEQWARQWTTNGLDIGWLM